MSLQAGSGEEERRGLQCRDKRGAGGQDGTRLASGSLAPKASGESRAQRRVLGAANGRRRYCWAPSHSVLSRGAAGGQLWSLHAPGLGLFPFLELGKVSEFLAAPRRTAGVTPRLRWDQAPHDVCPRLAARVRAWEMQVRPAGGLWARPSPNHFALSHTHAHKHRARGNSQPKRLAPAGAQCSDL